MLNFQYFSVSGAYISFPLTVALAYHANIVTCNFPQISKNYVVLIRLSCSESILKMITICWSCIIFRLYENMPLFKIVVTKPLFVIWLVYQLTKSLKFMFHNSRIIVKHSQRCGTKMSVGEKSLFTRMSLRVMFNVSARPTDLYNITNIELMHFSCRVHILVMCLSSTSPKVSQLNTCLSRVQY